MGRNRRTSVNGRDEKDAEHIERIGLLGANDEEGERAWSPAEVAEPVGWIVDRPGSREALEDAMEDGTLGASGYDDPFLALVDVAAKLSSLEVEDGTLEPEWLDLRDAVEASGRLVLRIDEDVAASVHAEADRLERVLAALISVAAPSGRSGGTSVHVGPSEAAPLADGPLVLRFEVDDGPARKKAKAADGDAGPIPASPRQLGLAVCTELVSLPEGVPADRPQPGDEGTFWLTFPTRVVTEVET